MPADLPPLHAAEAKAAMVQAYRPGYRPESFRNCRHPLTWRHPNGASHRVRCTAEWVLRAEKVSGDPEVALITTEFVYTGPLVAVRRPNGKVEVIEKW